MHIKFLARGTGSARAAAKYLLGERDAAGKPREGVEVLRGNPRRVASVADTLGFEHRYTSGVIAWAPEDQPTDEQIGAVLDAFEETAWAGLEPDRYAWAAVLHREEGGGAHVHVLAARCDLETGRSLNSKCPQRRILLWSCNLGVSVVRLPPIDSRWSGFQSRTLRRPSRAVLSRPVFACW